MGKTKDQKSKKAGDSSGKSKGKKPVTETKKSRKTANNFKPYTPTPPKIEEEQEMTIDELSASLNDQIGKIGNQIENFYFENLSSVESQFQVVLGMTEEASGNLRSMYSTFDSIWGDSFQKLICTGTPEEIIEFLKNAHHEKYLAPIKKHSQAFLHVFLEKTFNFITLENVFLSDWISSVLMDIQGNKTQIDKHLIGLIVEKCNSIDSSEWKAVQSIGKSILETSE